jgi:uncharacterized protein (DUF1800 family)
MARQLDPSDIVNSKLVARAGIRANEDDIARIRKDAWSGWVHDQLEKRAEDNAAVSDFLSSAKLKISYEDGEGYKALTEERPLSSLQKPTRELWHLVDWQRKMAWEERIRPGQELFAATLMRATLSDAQLRETIVDFWRDHFSINRDAVEDVQVALPTYDQDVLRKHALGNFREMLEAVASSTAMLAYLNNNSSRASPANENYARELMELHSLGAGAYLNDKFDKWREVPGAAEGKPQGYIDEDVYEAARAFTGWSYESGQYVTDGVTMPMTGEFTYIEHWHDPYQKRVLGVEFDSHLGPLVDGRKVLDLVAFHPATAHFVCKRLCQRFVADQPPEDLVKSAAQVFADNAHTPDQLKKVIAHVLLSREFANAQPRLQRPLFLMASVQRSAGVVFDPDPDHTWILDQMGHKLYAWHSPAGHPLASGYWQSPGLLVRRWRGLNDIWQRVMAKKTDASWDTADALVDEWTNGLRLPAEQSIHAKSILKQQFGDTARKTGFHQDDRWAVSQALTFLSATPDYQAV